MDVSLFGATTSMLQYRPTSTVAQPVNGRARHYATVPSNVHGGPARERAGSPQKARLRGLRQAAQAAFGRVARPFTGRV